ncbi:hypothetical protein ACFE04_000125 [Oxalis oulophora]
MPGLAQNNEQQSISSSNASSFCLWSKNNDVVTYNQLQKFWSELSPQGRRELLKIDKQTLFEQARKNMYCSRCNGLLSDGYLQILMYGKSLLHDGLSNTHKVTIDEIQDPAVHPWGGLITTRDGSLTILDCYLYSKSLKGLRNVFDSARGRERERELLYPDACGGGGRGWISQPMASYGRGGHVVRETCALHTARLSCDTLVDFWSALGEETRQSLLKMKEEDFIERLMYRFDSKRFCRDCRRNVIREFKELKELKRCRKEPRCTSWFCVANTDIHFEVSHDTVRADWHQIFSDKIGSYHHFEWAVGSGEGKSDILEFENVGMNGSVHVNGLDLGGLTACYITLRAWKLDGRCSELSFKAHALKNQQCVHNRLVVGDGYVTITRGESIRRFFEHAEEAEEEEDDDSVDKDGNELDGECSRPQKHAKSPELAREFLLDAATVIFKEQAWLLLGEKPPFSSNDHVEKAFREGTARQNAHSMFVCLAVKLMEKRAHVACKEIITLEKQTKLLEEEEREKREEEERKERKKTKEREKKLRRKERLKEKEKKCPDRESNNISPPEISKDESPPSVDEEQNNSFDYKDSVSENGDDNTLSTPESPDNFEEELMNEFYRDGLDGEDTNVDEENATFTTDQPNYSRQGLKFRKEFQISSSPKWGDRRRSTAAEYRSESRYHSDNFEIPSRGIKGPNRQLRVTAPKSYGWKSGGTFNEKSQSCSCNNQGYYREKCEQRGSAVRFGRDFKPVCKPVSAVETPKQFYRGNKYNQMDYVPRSKNMMGNNPNGREFKKVWEPMETQRKNIRVNSDFDSVEGTATDSDINKSFADVSIGQNSNSAEVDHEDDAVEKSGNPMNEDCTNEAKDLQFSSDTITSTSSNSDNCSSCLSEGAFSNNENLDNSSTSDSEDVSQQSEERDKDSSVCIRDGFSEPQEDKDKKSFGTMALESKTPVVASQVQAPVMKTTLVPETGIPSLTINNISSQQHQGMFQPIHNRNIQIPIYQQAAPSVGYYHQSPVPWSSGPINGLIPFSHSSHYLYATPLGYNANGMQYAGPHRLATPVFNPSHVPVYQPLPKTNNMNKDEQPLYLKPTAGREAIRDAYVENYIAGRNDVPADNKSAKVQMDDNGFSLFHSGGPIALTGACKSDPVPSKDGIVGGLSSQFSVEGEHAACNKKENTIEEYNLFATGNNSIKFSIF